MEDNVVVVLEPLGEETKGSFQNQVLFIAKPQDLFRAKPRSASQPFQLLYYRTSPASVCVSPKLLPLLLHKPLLKRLGVLVLPVAAIRNLFAAWLHPSVM